MVSKILQKAEIMSYNERWKYMIGLGKDALNDQTLTQSLWGLATSDLHYERLLALMSAHGSFDKKIIMKLLEDPSSIGMGKVIPLAAYYLEDELLIDTIPRLSKQRRIQLVEDLRKIRRTEIIEFIFTQSDFVMKEELLLYTSEVFFKQQINQNKDQLESFSQKRWCHMARRFPLFTSQQIDRILNKSSEPSWLVRQGIQSVLYQFYISMPSMGLDLIKKVRPVD